jgi:hypothetical protein
MNVNIYAMNKSVTGKRWGLTKLSVLIYIKNTWYRVHVD